MKLAMPIVPYDSSIAKETSSLTTMVHLVIIISVVFAIYAGSLANGYCWDDTILFIGKESYASLDLSNIIGHGGTGLEYLPLRDLSYIADHALWGWEAFGFHLTNVLLFAANAVAVYFFTIAIITHLNTYAQKDTTSGMHAPAALILTLLFVVHPIQSQAVNFVTCRNVLLSGLFFFLSLLLFTRQLADGEDRFRRRTYLLSLLCFLLALLSKATVLPLPLVLAVIVLFSSAPDLKRKLLSIIPFAFLTAFFFVLHRKVGMQSKMIREDLYDFGMHDALVTAAKAVQIPFFYLSKVFYPAQFTVEYDVAFLHSIFHPYILLGMALLALCAWSAWRIRRTHPAMMFGLLLFLITLTPVLNLFPTRPVVADRYAFLPLYGVFLVIVLVWFSVLRSKLRLAGMAAGCSVLLVLAVISHDQNRVWESDLTLWKHAVAKMPHSASAYVNLGFAYRAAQDRKRSDEMFLKAVELNPSMNEYEYFRGADAFYAGDHSGAIEWLRKALKRRPGNMRTLFIMGLAYEQAGEYDRAIESLVAIRDSPEYDLYNYRSRASLRVNLFLVPKVEVRLNELRRAVAAKPADAATKIELANALLAYGQEEDASEIYNELAAQGVKDGALYFGLGEIARREGGLSSAIAFYRQSLALGRPNCEASTALGKLCMKRRMHAAAEDVLQAAIREEPSCSDARFHLAVSHFLRGNADSSRLQFKALENDHPAVYPTLAFVTKIPK